MEAGQLNDRMVVTGRPHYLPFAMTMSPLNVLIVSVALASPNVARIE